MKGAMETSTEQKPGGDAGAVPPAASLSLSPARVGPAEDFSGRSNLALSFLCLPAGKRADMNVFYTFCRVVDDIADSGEFSADEKRVQFDAWREALTVPTAGAGDGGLLGQVRELMGRYGLGAENFLEIIAGCAMDVSPADFPTWEVLRGYCYRVASCVGLVSVEIFGYRAEHRETLHRYAVELGLALQLTNIIRDVGKDVANGGRVYLPGEDLARFGLSAGDLRAGTADTGRLTELLRFEADRAEALYANARAALPASERRAMVAAEIMGAVYHRLLRRMRRDNFRVLSRDYGLSKAAKLWTMLTATVANRIRR